MGDVRGATGTFGSFLYRDPDTDSVVDHGWDSSGRTAGYGRRDEFLAGEGASAGDPEGFQFRSICGDYLCGLFPVLLRRIQPDQYAGACNDSVYVLSVTDIKRAGDRDVPEGEKDRIGISDGTRSEGPEGEGYDVCVSGGVTDRNAAGGLEGWPSGIWNRGAGLCALLSECDEIFRRNDRGPGWVLFVAV